MEIKKSSLKHRWTEPDPMKNKSCCFTVYLSMRKANHRLCFTSIDKNYAGTLQLNTGNTSYILP